MARVDMTLIRGDDRSIVIDIAGGDSEGIITGSTVFFTAKPELTNDVTDSSAVILVAVVNIQPEEDGTFTIPLTAIDTNKTPGLYHYDIQIKDADGVIVSTPSGRLEIVADVTRRIT